MADSTPTIRAGIVGSGFAARFHLEAMRKVYRPPQRTDEDLLRTMVSPPVLNYRN